MRRHIAWCAARPLLAPCCTSDNLDVALIAVVNCRRGGAQHWPHIYAPRVASCEAAVRLMFEQNGSTHSPLSQQVNSADLDCDGVLNLVEWLGATIYIPEEQVR